MSLREFGWDPATIATLRHSTLPWFEEPGNAGSLTDDLGTRDRLSLVAQFAAHQTFLQFAGIADAEFSSAEWAVVRKRGHDVRLVRTTARAIDPAAAPPLITLLHEFAERVAVTDLDALRRPWTRAETVYAEIDARLRRDATADLRWMRLAAAGEIVTPGPVALRDLWGIAARIDYADAAIADAIRLLAEIDGSVRVIDLTTGFAVQRYAGLAAIAPDLVGSSATETAAAETLVERLAKSRHVVLVPAPATLDPASRRAIEIASSVGGATWLIRGEKSDLAVSRHFVLSPRLAARRDLDQRLEQVSDRRQWVEAFVASHAYQRYLESGEIPVEEAALTALPEPNRSYVATLALVGSRVPLRVARSVLRHFLYHDEPATLVVPGLTAIDGEDYVFASEAVRDSCRSHIPVESRAALSRAAATLADGVSAAHLLIDSGDVASGLEMFEAARWRTPDECIRELTRIPQAMLTPALAASLAAALIDNGRYGDAHNLVPIATESQRELLLARIERRKGDYATALARLERLADRSFDAGLLHGELLRLEGRTADALRQFDSMTASDAGQRVRLAYERAIVELNDHDATLDGNEYLALRLRTYIALQRDEHWKAEELAAASLGKATSRSERIDSWLDRVYASFSSGRWESTRALALEALAEVDEAQGDRAAAGILFTLAYLAADSAQWTTAEQLIRRIRQQYERAGDWPRLFEVELLDAHVAFSRGDFAEAHRLASEALRRDNLLTQIREAAALIVDEVQWIDGHRAALQSTGRSGNVELDARHRSIRDGRETESASTNSERLKLFRSALRTGRRQLAAEIANDLGLRVATAPLPDATPVLTILRIAATVEYPFEPDAFGDTSWCFASRNRLGHWTSEGPAVFAPVDLDRIVAAPEGDWMSCSERDLLFIAGSTSWPDASRHAVASLFRLRSENRRLHRLSAADDGDRLSTADSTHGIAGQSPAIRTVFEVIERVAKRDVPVCIQGESGTGKELVARALHRSSPRRQKAFTALNCAALPENLIESELFGHARGAFTGADRDRPGLIESADSGTLFLDEIGELPLVAQAKLLRFLQEGEFRRVGETAVRTADVRVVTATNRRLEAAVEEGRFREDLYYRIRGIEIVIPPLRDRGSDVRLLAKHFLAAERNRHRSGPVAFSSEVESVLDSYRWPGNVRELQNTIRAAHAMAGDAREVHLEHLPERLRTAVPSRVPAGSYQDAVMRFRRDLIERSLMEAAGNQNRAAALLNMSRQALAYQIRELGILVKKSLQSPRL